MVSWSCGCRTPDGSTLICRNQPDILDTKRQEFFRMTHEHHRLVVEKSVDVVYGPVEQPYGYREYSLRDPERALWSFVKPLE